LASNVGHPFLRLLPVENILVLKTYSEKTLTDIFGGYIIPLRPQIFDDFVGNQLLTWLGLELQAKY